MVKIIKTSFVELVLTCGSWQEAQRIADHLLEARLVACVEFVEIKSRYWWKQKIEQANEIKLVMESIAENFDAVEAALKKTTQLRNICASTAANC